MTSLTVYLAAGALALIGGWLVWTRLRPGTGRHLALAGLVVVAAFAAARADWIVTRVTGERAVPLDDVVAEGSGQSAELLRELLALEPDLRDWIEALAADAAGQADPLGYIVQRSFAMGKELSRTLMPRLAAAGDAAFQRLLDPLVRVAARLPDDPPACARLMSGGGGAWAAELATELPDLADDFVAGLLAVVRDAKDRAPKDALTAEEIDFLNEQMLLWISRLSRDEMAQIGAMGGGQVTADTLGGICSIFRKLFEQMASLPPPEGGRLLRLVFAAGAQED